MIKYADYQFYSKEYKGSLSIDLFNSLIIKASMTIDNHINCTLTEARIKKLSERDQYKLKFVACELCDFINVSGGNSGKLGYDAGSISIDGVSINGSANIKSESQMKKDKQNILNDLPLELIRYL